MEKMTPTNSGYDAKSAQKLTSERIIIFKPPIGWTYSHHPHITFFKGRFHAIWSNGRLHEDDLGQRVMMASSADFCEWTPPCPLLDSQMGKDSELVMTAAGFHEHNGTLVAYVGQYEYCLEQILDGHRIKGDRGHRYTTLRAMTTTDGINWNEPIDLKLPIVPNHGPQKTASGRLIICGNISFPYSDDPTGIGGWNMTGIYPSDMQEYIVDDSESFHEVKEHAGWPVGLCEGSFYQTDDSVLHMLLRSGTEKLWYSESQDDGVNWSEPIETDFSDNATKFHFGRMPNGLFYYVGCPDTEIMYSRCPLVLSTSADGIHFDRHYILADEPYTQQADGMYKGGQYGYPHTLLHQGFLYVIVSRQKEAVEVLRFDLGDLD